MSIEIVRTFTNPAKTRKLNIFRRDNGSYGFEDMKYGEEESAWSPVGRYSVAVFDTEEMAIRESKSRVSWVAKELKDAI